MSLNVQVVSGPNMEIFNIVIRWPGSAHDNRILENSSIMVAFEERRMDGILLGDSGYAQKEYLYMPCFIEKVKLKTGTTVPMLRQEMLWNVCLVFGKEHFHALQKS